MTGLGGEGLRLELEDGNEVTATGDYLAEGHLAHGYAMTIHKSQGATVDRAFLLGDDGLYQEAAVFAENERTPDLSTLLKDQGFSLYAPSGSNRGPAD